MVTSMVVLLSQTHSAVSEIFARHFTTLDLSDIGIAAGLVVIPVETSFTNHSYVVVEGGLS